MRISIAGESVAATSGGEASDTIHVLHVDDEPDLAETAAAFLQREDTRFEIAS